MKTTILISLLFLIATKSPYSKTPATLTNRHDHFASIDTSRYTIIKFNENSDYNIFDKSYKPATLLDDDIIQIEKLINKNITEYNKSKKKGIYPLVINHPEKYYKQFVAAINSKGEKEVWVNCFCSIMNEPDWKTRIIGVLDGGSCFFQLKINLTKNIIYDLTINGVG